MLRSLLFKSLLLTLFVGFLGGCYYDVEEELYPGFCNTEQVNYQDVILPLMELRCSLPGCHVVGGNGNGVFTNYGELKATVDNGSLVREVFVLGTMPQNGSLSRCELDQLQVWVDAGAPEF